MATITFHNPRTGQTREAPVGFSWTTLFFGGFVPLVRSDWKWALISFLLSVVTAGVSWLIFPFVYNKLYIRSLVENGFEAKEANGETLAALSNRLGIAL